MTKIEQRIRSFFSLTDDKSYKTSKLAATQTTAQHKNVTDQST